MVITTETADSVRWAYVYSSNGNKSLSAVHLPQLPGDKVSKNGYDGRDEFEFIESSFVHLFPVYKDDKPTGKYHKVQYKSKPGEAMKQLVPYKTVDF